MIPEYCNTILVLIIFSNFSDRQSLMMVPEKAEGVSTEQQSKMKLSQFLNLKQKAKKEKPEAFPATPKGLLAISKRTAFKDETAFNDIEVQKLIDALLTNSRVIP